MWPFKSKPVASKHPGPIETALVNARSFNAAEVSAVLGPWTFDGGFSNGEISAALSTVRARCRDMAKNSEYFNRFLRLFVANVAGPNGFRLKSTAELSSLDARADEDAASFIETHWERWASNPNLVDSAGVLDLPGLLRLAAESWARDGEAFIVVDTHAQNKYGVSLRVVRPDCCDETLNGNLGNGRIIRLGVERDAATGRAIAYYFNSNREDPTASYFLSKPRVRIPADHVLHVYEPHDAMQSRGFPLGHAVIRALKMLDEFRFAELVAARDNTNTLGFFNAPAGRDGEIKSLAKDDRVRNRLEGESSPGLKTILPQGWDFKWTHPEHPNAQLAPFEQAILRGVASGLGVEYSNFANNWAAVNYSSVRAGTLAERDQWMTYQATLVSRLLNPLFAIWLKSFLTLRVSPADWTEQDFERLYPHDFIGRRWQWVDPMKDVNAAVLAIRNGLTTQSRVAAEYGTDADDNITENERIHKAFQAAGLSSPFDPQPGAAAPTSAADESTQQSEDN